MLHEAPLGWAKVKAGLRLRKAMLINAILFNSESLHDVSQDDVESLEQVDQALLRGLVKGHAQVGLPALYMDLGQEPIRFILAQRRIMYLQTILKRNPSDLTRRTYEAQKSDPVNGDFCLLVKKDMDLLNLKLEEEEINVMKKQEFKLIIKNALKEEALKYLIEESEKKGIRKTEKIIPDKLAPMPYLTNKLFTRKEASLLFSLRTRTVRG